MALRCLVRRAGLLLLAAAILVLPVAVSGAGSVWTQLGDVPDPERQEVSYVGLGGYTYLAGGNHTDHQRFDPATGTWANVARLPDSFVDVDHVQGAVADGKIVYIGGIEKWDPPAVASAVAIYTPPTLADPLGSFTEGKPIPRPRGAGGVAVHDGKVVYAGGLTEHQGAVAWVDEYDPAQDDWRQLGDMPRPRDHFGAAVVGDTLYAIGGRDTRIAGGKFDVEASYAEVDALDLDSGDWEAGVTNIPTPRGGHGVATIGSCVYAVGGEGVDSDPNGVTGVTESYDTVTGEWTSHASLMTPRHGIQAAVVGATIYIAAGGSVEEDYEPVIAHESLNVAGVAGCSDDGGGGDPGGGPGGGPGDAGPDAGPGARAPGAGEPPSGDDTATPVAPRLIALRLSPRRFHTTGRRRGTRIEVSLSAPATVRLRFERAVAGRRISGRCRGATRRLRHRPPCIRWARVGQLRLRGGAGSNRVGFSGALGSRTLKPGHHRVVGSIAEDRHSRPVRSAFRVVPRSGLADRR